ncbi:MAG TPA: peptide ABC transporter ATP-binding protein, partial [Burkholderiales bacterium]|nr:peptide ABC transporter ATP-binding protein [Burkholderiales bacterium]
PTIMLFDEITSALDPELVGGILELLRELSQTRSMTMIIVIAPDAFRRGMFRSCAVFRSRRDSRRRAAESHFS